MGQGGGNPPGVANTDVKWGRVGRGRGGAGREGGVVWVAGAPCPTSTLPSPAQGGAGVPLFPLVYPFHITQ